MPAQLLLSALGLLGLLGLAVPQFASATQAHYYAGASFGEPGPGAGRLALRPAQFPEVGGSALAVDEQTGEVYVADTENHRVAKFSAAGNFIAAFGWGVADGSPEPQTCTLVCQAGIPGSAPGQFQAPIFVAIDNSPGGEGDLYVGDSGDSTITKLTSSGALVTSWGEGGQLRETPSLAVATGDLTAGSAEITNLSVTSGTIARPQEIVGEGIPPSTFVESVGASSLRMGQPATLTKAGVELHTRFRFGPLSGIAADDGDLLVLGSRVNRAFRFSRSAAYLGEFFEDDGARPSGLTLDGEGNAYAVNGLGVAEKFGPSGASLARLTLPPPAAEPAIGVSASAADGYLYVDEGRTVIGSYSSSCQLIEEDGVAPHCAPFQRFGEAELHSAAGVTVDSATGTVYAASTEDDRIVAFPVAIEASTGVADGVTASSATLHATVNPKGSELSACRFEYGEGGAEGHLSVPCAESPAGIGAGTSPVPVEAEISALLGATTYRFRLRATNGHGDVKGEEEEFTSLASPSIGGVQATGLEGGSATLRALIDPRGSATHYRFEWGPCPGTCATSPYSASVPVPDEPIGSGTGPVAVEQSIAGLQTGATYHFRAVATNGLGTTTGPDHTFIEQPSSPIETGCSNEELRQVNGSPALPDCRAYELVTPTHKNGSLIGGLLFGGIPQIVPGGGAVISPAVQCFAQTPSCVGHRGSEGEPYEFFRTASGWQTAPLAPDPNVLRTNSWWSYGATSGQVLFSGPVANANEEALYVREPDGTVRLVGPLGDKPGISFSSISGVVPFESTADFSHLLYGTVGSAWSFDSSQGHGLYEYVAGAPAPQLVGVSGGAGSRDLIGACGTGLGSGDAAAKAYSRLYNAISSDGRIVFFTPNPCATGSGANQGKPISTYALYERIDGERTIELSTPTPSTCTTSGCQESKPAPSNFEGASQDGEFALFTSTQKLTDHASQDSASSDTTVSGGCLRIAAGASGCNLYASICPSHCEEPAQRQVIDVSEGAEGSGGPRVQGVVALSPDGSHTYFVAKGVLASQPNALGEDAQEGAANLYLYERDQAHPTGRLSFVTTLAASDRRLWGSAVVENVQGLGLANVSPDGRFLVFTSHSGLTPDARPGEGPAQVYRFDSATQQMTRSSIGAAGYNDNGNSAAAGADAEIRNAASAFAFGDGPAYPDPTMSDDGRFIFFESPLALVPGALSEVVVEESGGKKFYAQNIYEWEQDGAGGCMQSGGCVSLLSDGAEAIGGGQINIHTPELLGSDASGEDVFIAVKDPLTWQDTDTQRDFYDVKVRGGFSPPPEVSPCSGDGCKGSGTSPALVPAPGTSAASGPEEGPRHPRKHRPKHRKQKKHRAKHHRRSKTNRSAQGNPAVYRRNPGGK